MKLKFVLLWAFVSFLASAEDIKIAPVVDPGVGQCGSGDVRGAILSMKDELAAIMGDGIAFSFIDQLKYNKLGELFATNAENAAEISAILTVSKCSRQREDLALLKNDFPWSISLDVLSRGCPRPPPGVGLGVPFLRDMNDIVPFLVDSRSDNRLLDKWDDIVVIHDDSINVNSLEAIVFLLQTTGVHQRSTSVTIYNVCVTITCEDMASVIRDFLLPIATSEFPRYFLIIATGKSTRKVVEQAKKLQMMDSDRQWLLVTTKPGEDYDLLEATSSLPSEANVAIVWKGNVDVNCIDPIGCQLSKLLIAYASSVRDLVASGQYQLNETSVTKARVRQHMLDYLDKEIRCGGCLEFMIKTTAYLLPGKTTAETLDDYETVGTWKLFTGLKMSGVLFPLTTRNFRGKKIKIGIAHGPPCALVKEDKRKKGRYDYAGLTVDFVKEMSKEMNFTYEFILAKDSQTGQKLPNGEWTGMIGQIVRGEVEFAAQCFYVTPERMEVVNFTMAVDELAYALLLRRPEQQHKYLFLAPFTNDVWICLFVAVIVIGPVLYLVHRASVYYSYHDMVNDRGLFRYANCAWYGFGAIVQQGGVHLPIALSGRVMVSFWWLFVIVTVTTYSGNLVAVLTFPKIRNPVNTFEELLASRLKWGITDGEALIEQLRASTSKTMMDVYRGLNIYSPARTGYVLQQVKDSRMVFIAARYELLDIMSRDYNETGKCNYMIGSDDVHSASVSLAVPRGWPYLSTLNSEIARLFESGLFIRWKKTALPPDNECTTTSKPQAGDTRKISISQMIGSFYILMFGICSAILVLVGEFFLLRYRSKGQLPPSFKGLGLSNFKLIASLSSEKKFLQSRMYPNFVEQDRRRKKRKKKKSDSIPPVTGEENEGYMDTVWGLDDQLMRYDGRRNIYSDPGKFAVKRDFDNPHDGTKRGDDDYFANGRY